ncbi:MAG: CpsD/CapB family tyrosine-protein kinase [Oscillospiraceae bacterium]|nr:CpsD/CapB family tyrosine-protein kinase [Oscillospiraceae bacterium]
MSDNNIKNNKNVESTRTNDIAEFGAELNFATKEAYALLRANLSFSLLEKAGGKKIGITSSVPQEGKSTISINLAYSLADAGNKVLLMDGDMRRGSIARKLKKRSSHGLAEYLSGKENLAVHTNVLIDGLDVIVRGDTPPNPSELMGSERMEKTLDTLAERYDYIIVDLPPVNSVADPLIISTYLDGVIVVVRHEHTRSDLVRETIHRLKFARAHIFGFVYNAYSKHHKNYYRGYYKNRYKDYYRYYTSRKTTEERTNNDPSKETITEIK